jgi:hypothetical protein
MVILDRAVLGNVIGHGRFEISEQFTQAATSGIGWAPCRRESLWGSQGVAR